MHTIVKAFGGLQALIGIAIGAFGINMASQNLTAGLSVIGIAFGVIVSGALFWCFGAIVQHLIAIRAASERQADALEAVRNRATAKTA